MPLPPEGDSASGMTVVVPVHDAERTLGRCLEAVLASRGAGPLDLVVVDDGSTDESLRIASGFPCRVVPLSPRGGPARARNRGAAEARSPHLAFVDADVLVRPDTLAGLRSSLAGAEGAFATYAPDPGEPGFATAFYHTLSLRSLRDTAERTTVFYSYCAAVRRDVFADLGGFDESFTRATFEDMELGLRLSARGHRVVHRRDLQVTHLVRYEPFTLLRAYFRKSRDLAGLLLSRGRVTFGDQGWTRRRNFADLAAALSTVLLWPALFLGPAIVAALWGLLAAFFVASAFPLARSLGRRRAAWAFFAFPFLLAVHVTAACAAIAALAERSRGKAVPAAAEGDGRSVSSGS